MARGSVELARAARLVSLEGASGAEIGPLGMPVIRTTGDPLLPGWVPRETGPERRIGINSFLKRGPIYMNCDVKALQKALLEIYLERENEPRAGNIAAEALNLTEAEYCQWLDSRIAIEGQVQRRIDTNPIPQRVPSKLT